MQNNETYNDLIEYYEKYDSVGAKLLRDIEEVDEKKYEALAEELMRWMEQEPQVPKKEAHQTQNFKFLTEVPGTNRKRVVNVPQGYSKGEPTGSDTSGLMDEEVRSSFYNPATKTTTLVFSNGREENWASKSIEDLRETHKGLTSDYDCFVYDSENTPVVREAIQIRLKSLKMRLDAIDKIHGVWNKTNLGATGPQKIQGARGVRGWVWLPEHDSDEAPNEVVKPQSTEEILALDTVTFQLWAEEASADELEVFANWKAPESFFQKLLNFLRKLGW